MPSHRLSALFDPQSVAVVGASSVAASVGGALWRAICPGADNDGARARAFAGRAYAVNPKYAWIGETPCYRRLTDLPEPVDLALIAIPADAVAEVIRDCGRAGCRFAVVFSRTDHETLSTEALLRVAREAKVRLIGPAARGVVRSLSRLDATAHEGAPVGAGEGMPDMPGERIAIEPGSISVLSQSGAWLSVLRDFARGTSIRFASLMATGEAADLDVGELLDYFAFDPATREVLTYTEDIRDAAAFMSSVRQLARMKPVVIMKAGHADRYRLPDGTQATALLRHDRVVDAAIRRAGAVRAQTVVHMVGTARLLAGQGQRTYRRVAVLTNGRGPGVVALDAISARGLVRAQFSDETVLALRHALPLYASVANPVDVAGDADEVRMERALGILVADPDVDCVLVLYAPQPLLAPEALARILRRAAEASPKAIVTVLGGGVSVLHARRQLDEARVAQFLTIENALDAMATMDSFATHQAILREVPPRQSVESAPDRDGAQRVLDAARSAGRSVLLPQEAAALLAAFGIPVAASSSLDRPAAAVAAAERLGYPVRLSAVTTGIDAEAPLRERGLETPDEVRRAWRRLRNRATRSQGAGEPMQVTLEAEHRSAATRELFVGLANDPVFGCVLAVGAGGPAVAQIDDIALELPPVNRVLIHHWLRRTRVSRLLDTLGDLPAANVESLIELLECFSALACACPEVLACDLNPVLVDEGGALVGAARIVLRTPSEADALRRGRPYAHLAIHPYPAELAERVTLRTGASVLLRPIRPDDAALEQAFVAALAPETRYFRFMMNVRELTPGMIERFTQIDYRHELALIALEGESTGEGTGERMCAVARITPSGGHEECEFAIVVGEWMQGSGLGRALMDRLMAAAAERGYRSIYGLVLAENVRMLGFCESLGFRATADEEDPALIVVRRAL